MSLKNCLRTVAAILAGVYSGGLVSTSCFAYGAQGHSFIGALAESRLAHTSPAALKEATALLGGLSLDAAATIPDEIRSWDRLPADEMKLAKVTDLKSSPGKLVGIKWPPALRQAVWEYFKKNSDLLEDHQMRHHVYHFADIAIAPSAPLVYRYDQHVIGESDTDIVHMLVKCFGLLQGRKTDAERGITPAIALILICHFAGDLHQPLHIGAEYFAAGTAKPIDPNGLKPEQYTPDRGGNSIAVPEDDAGEAGARDAERVIPGASSSNLHSIWDTDAVRVAFENLDVPPKFAHSAFLAKLTAADPAPGDHFIPAPGTLPAAYFSEWATEILPLSREAHQRLSFELGNEVTKSGQTRKIIEVAAAPGNAGYLEWAGTQVERELRAGGYRLAWVLQQALAVSHP